MFRELINNIYDKQEKITIIESKININNYEDILLIDPDKVIIKTKNKTIKISGSNLAITKLLNKEVLIEGVIEILEMR